MANIQEIFNQIEERKKESRDIKRIYKDALENSQEYKNIAEELKTLKEKKKQLEETIKQDFTSEFDKLDQIKTDMETDKMLMSDLAINHLTKGELIEIKDKNDNKYEPKFSVSFKKIE